MGSVLHFPFNISEINHIFCWLVLIDLWYLTPLSSIYRLYRGGQFYVLLPAYLNANKTLIITREMFILNRLNGRYIVGNLFKGNDFGG
jgi:hypothetical protein